MINSTNILLAVKRYLVWTPLSFGEGVGVRLVFGGIVMLFFFTSCEEIGPVIDLTGTFTADTTYVTTQVESPQIKNVLLEEFTGVRCVNCPTGHDIMNDLESPSQYGSRFIGVSAHSLFQSEPYDGDQNLHNPQADDLDDILGPAIVKPSGAIDRKQFPEDDILTFTIKWATYVAEQMTLTTPVNIHITVDYNNIPREVEAVVTLHYTSEDTLDSRLTVMILEDNITTIQANDTEIDSNYVQNRVLRQILPSASGIPLSISRERGRVIVRTYNFALSSDWNEENLRIIAFVHRSGETMEVVQVQQKSIKP